MAIRDAVNAFEISQTAQSEQGEYNIVSRDRAIDKHARIEDQMLWMSHSKLVLFLEEGQSNTVDKESQEEQMPLKRTIASESAER